MHQSDHTPLRGCNAVDPRQVFQRLCILNTRLPVERRKDGVSQRQIDLKTSFEAERAERGVVAVDLNVRGR